MKRPSLSPLRLFESPAPFPQLAGATASGSGLRGGAMMFARNTGGNGNGGGGTRPPDDFDPDYDEYAEHDEPADPAASRGSRRAGTSGGAASGGRQRTVQFQSEERYWTEYLRIALPVVGLLLMLGLFWFWAQNLIGDDNGKEPTATEQPGIVVTATETINTPTPTEQSQIVQPTLAPTQPVATQAPAEPTQPATDAATPPPATGEITIGGTVVTNDADINMRPDASTAGDPVATLANGTTLTVIDGPVSAEGYTWWQVETAEGQTGWIVADFLTPSE